MSDPFDAGADIIDILPGVGLSLAIRDKHLALPLIAGIPDYSVPLCAGKTISPFSGGYKGCEIGPEHALALQIGSHDEITAERRLRYASSYAYMPDVFSLNVDILDGLSMGYSLRQEDGDVFRDSVGFEEMKRGSFKMKYKVPFEPRLTLSDDPDVGAAQCTLGASYAPEYFNLAEIGYAKHKTTLHFGCNMEPIDNLRLMFNTNIFPIAGQQQPWDSDFVYSLNYKIGDHFEVGFSDYTGNRFPWRGQEGDSNFFDGGLLTARYKRKF